MKPLEPVSKPPFCYGERCRTACVVLGTRTILNVFQRIRLRLFGACGLAFGPVSFASRQRGGVKQVLALLIALLFLIGVGACSSGKKKKVLYPLALEIGSRSQAVALTEQGTEAYKAKQYEEAKNYFSQAVTAAPQSGPAHYNYALALNVLGESEQARRHFMEAANLAPGDKVIWDSPPLSPYNNPENEEKTKSQVPANPNRRGAGGGIGGGIGGR